LDTSESRSEIPENFEMWCCRRLEKISWADRVGNEVLHRVKKERNILYIINRRKANWIGHGLRRNFHFLHVIEETIDIIVIVTGRQERRRK
jgi:hypothetical protein